MPDKEGVTNGSPRIELENIQPLGPHDRALYQSGVSLLQDSIETSRGFCRFLIGASSSAIPIFLGVLALVLPENFRLTILDALILLFPILGFLLVATLSTIGYLPQSAEISLEILDEIRGERIRLIHHRRSFGIAASIIMLLSTLAALVVIIMAIQAYAFVPPSTR